MSLRARILLLVLLATLLPMVVVGLYEFKHRAGEIDKSKVDLSALAKYAAGNLGNKVDGTVQMLHGLSRAPDLATADRAACSEFLAGVLARYPQYTGLLTITPDGDVFCDSLRTGRKLNVSTREYFKQARATGEPAFDLVIGGLSGIGVLQVAYPVLDAVGEFKFMVLASLNLSKYAEDFAAASAYPDTRVLLWNRKGMLVARKPDGGPADVVGKEFAESALFRFATSNESGAVAEMPDLVGIPRVWALGVSREDGGGARIILGIPRAVLSAAANQRLLDSLLLLIGVSLLAFFAALVISELSIRRPAARVIGVATRLAAGDLKARIGEPRPRGELGDLMSAIDRTAGAVQAQQGEIESRSRDLGRANRTLRVLSGINTLIVRVRARDELFREACRIAVEAGGFRMAMIAIVDRISMAIVPVASAGKSEELLATIRRLASSPDTSSTTMIARAVSKKVTIVSNNSIDDPQVLLGQQYAESGVRSMVILPLLVADHAAGALALYAGEIDFFHEEELKLLTELAGDIGFAIDHIGNQERLSRLSRVQAVTSEINSLIVRVRERQDLFNEVCRIAVEHGKFGSAWIGALDYGTNEISSVACAGDAADELARTRSTWRPDVKNGTGVVSSAIREKRPVFDNDIAVSATGRSSRRTAAIRAGFRSLIAVPFVINDLVVGQVSLYATETGFFNHDEVELLAGMAGNISFALENIDRQEKLDKVSRIRAVSGKINSAIVRLREREALLQEICRIVADHGKFELVWVATVDIAKNELRPVAWAGFSAETAHAVKRPNLRAGSSPLAEVVRTGKLAVSNDFESAGAATPLREEALKRGCHSTVCLPLLVDDNLVAVISVFARGRNFFDPDELALLTEVAADLSFALQSIARRAQLDYLAYYDVLTGLANRTLFHERLEQSVTAAKDQGRKIALVLLDIERFKTINDTLGRQAGDLLLKELAARVSVHAVDVSRLARLDADHFAVMVTDVHSGEALARLVEQRDGEIFGPSFRIVDAKLRVSAKFGIALFPDDGSDADTLFRNAEAALKNAKSRGHRYRFYAPAMNARVAEKLSLEYRLRRAIEREEFVLHYQPKVNLASGKLSSCEALIRWNDPQTGLVPPGQFIPILEETGLIYEVGRWALRQATADYLRWRAAGLPAVRIAVNVSPLQLRNREFIGEIEKVTGTATNAAAGLELEITESVIMDDVEHNIATLRAIRAMGVTIAIDDFGTGFSSLNSLAKLPVDTLKIDRSFVIEMTSGPQGMALVSTIVNLAHSMKLKVVAEGVETEEQSRLLRLLNCDEMQGYLFSKPVPADIFEARFLAPHEEVVSL